MEGAKNGPQSPGEIAVRGDERAAKGQNVKSFARLFKGRVPRGHRRPQVREQVGTVPRRAGHCFFTASARALPTAGPQVRETNSATRHRRG